MRAYIVTLDVLVVEDEEGAAPDEYGLALGIEEGLPDEWFVDRPDGYGIEAIRPQGWFDKEA